MSSSKEEIDKVYAHLSSRIDKLYQFILTYSDYIGKPRDYGTGLLVSMVEVHILTLIEDHPGITISDLAKKWRRTKSAISQNVKKLEAKGLVHRVRDGDNAKVFHLYPTNEGVRLSTAHKLYDNVAILQAHNDLLRTCTPEELDAFYKVLDAYSKRS